MAAGRQSEMIAMKRRTHLTRGTCWIRAKYPGRCHCGRPIRPGERALYFPASKKLSCWDCGRVDAMRISADDLQAIFKAR